MSKILFVCSANKDRSKTAEDYFSAKYLDKNFDSAGTNKKICQQLGTNFISKEQLDAADRILVMEHKHLKVIKDLFGSKYHNKISVLHIKDLYKYGSSELIDILIRHVSL
ncbi:MAG: phosphotyrosine protein phosphatase [Nonlabens sp.]